MNAGVDAPGSPRRSPTPPARLVWWRADPKWAATHLAPGSDQVAHVIANQGESR